ncbi:MAG: SRPBCC family protein [Candidatus Krumholzibacteria bacterium]|nr:SRPBCC family protein [Candidatus Krumholzibacteria bacterium]
MLAVLFSLVLAVTTGSVIAGESVKTHPHQGILPPYEPVAMDIILDEEQLEKLADGKLVQMTIEDEKAGGRGIGVIDIAAPVDTVWSRIMGFEHYPEWVGPVDFCEVYHQAGDTTNTHVKISGFLYSYEYYLTNFFWPEQNMLTWTLDYSRESEFDDCVGAWYVEAHPDKDGWSRAWFSSDLKLNSPLPGFLMNFIKKKGIRDATSWVKEQSEIAVQSPEGETE